MFVSSVTSSFYFYRAPLQDVSQESFGQGLLIFLVYFIIIICISLYVPTAVKNPREGTRSPRMGHDLKRTYDIMEGSRGHTTREATPYEG